MINSVQFLGVVIFHCVSVVLLSLVLTCVTSWGVQDKQRHFVCEQQRKSASTCCEVSQLNWIALRAEPQQDPCEHVSLPSCRQVPFIYKVLFTNRVAGSALQRKRTHLQKRQACHSASTPNGIASMESQRLRNEDIKWDKT